MEAMAMQLQNTIVNFMKRIEGKINFIENEIITIKCWLNDDSKLSPYEKKLVDETIKKVKADNFTDMTSFEELKEKIGA
tara:strand:+ start:645 stop:881 length:237 start_codon:yes stop_codon:yes gene_type:complete